MAHPYRHSSRHVQPSPRAVASLLEVVLALFVGIVFCVFLLMHPAMPRMLLGL